MILETLDLSQTFVFKTNLPGSIELAKQTLQRRQLFQECRTVTEKKLGCAGVWGVSKSRHAALCNYRITASSVYV